MTKITQETRVLYANAINILFGGTINASPEEINLTVIRYVDTVMKEIATCSRNITELTFDLIYKFSVEPVVGFVLEAINNKIIEDKIGGTVEDVLKDWVLSLAANRQFVGCLYKARANWRSAIQMELWGI